MSMEGKLSSVVEMLKKMNIKEIAGIRGLSMIIDDLDFEEAPIDTLMWNPLHFAVYGGHIDIVKMFIEKLHINIGLRMMRS